ncbi:MAG: hypothetical protein F4133_13685 [Gammaproteobacteria bacterium]|nr:hypothetical protein [Gammaproteobacteria bacterium]
MSNSRNLGIALFLVLVLLSLTVVIVSTQRTSTQRFTSYVRVVADSQEYKATLTYNFTPPTRSILFGNRNQEARHASWKFRNPEFEFNKNGFSHRSGEPFDTVTIDAVGQKPRRAREYPFLVRMGNSGLVLATRHLVLDSPLLHAIQIEAENEDIVAFSNYISEERVQRIPLPNSNHRPGHFLYIGPRNAKQRLDDGSLVLDPRLPTWLLEAIPEKTILAYKWVDAFFGSESVTEPFVMVSFEPDRHELLQNGRTSLNGEILLVLGGEEWLQETMEMKVQLSLLLAHEFVHIENSVKVRTGREEPAWLWEGLAEYVGTLHATWHTGFPSGDVLQWQIRRWANHCVSYLKEESKGISHPLIRNERVSGYECGALAYWIIDGAPTGLTQGDEIRMYWSALIGSLENQPKEYGVADVLSTLANSDRKQEREFVTALIEGPASAHWVRFEQFLQKRLGDTNLGIIPYSPAPMRR